MGAARRSGGSFSSVFGVDVAAGETRGREGGRAREEAAESGSPLLRMAFSRAAAARALVAAALAACLCACAEAHPPRDLANFQNNFRCDTRTKIARPDRYGELINIVKGHSRLQAVGAGHSWNHMFFCPELTDDSVGVTMSTLPQYVHVNATEETVIVSAGIKQRRLLDYLAQYGTDEGGPGWTLPAFSWFIDQTMGGAVATDTHGSSVEWGSLSSARQLLDLWLLLANGTVVHLNDEIDPHLMRAARVNVGRLGINLFMRFRIVPQLQVRRTSVKMRPGEFVDQVLEAQREFRDTGAAPGWLEEMHFFWFVQTSRVWRSTFERLSPRIGSFGGEGDWPEEFPRPEAEIASDPTTSWRAPRRLMPDPSLSGFDLFGIGKTLTTNAWERYFATEFLTDGVYSARNAYLSMTEELKEELVDKYSCVPGAPPVGPPPARPRRPTRGD